MAAPTLVWALLSSVVLLLHPSAAWSWSLPAIVPEPLPRLDVLSQWQDQLLENLWHQHKDSLSFCTGAELSDAKLLLKESFPSPLPVGPEDDALCSNSSLVMSHLCSPEAELQFYMKVCMSPSMWQTSVLC